MADLVDTHAHLDAEQFSSDLPAVLERACAAGVRQVVAIGITATSSENCVRLAQHETSKRSEPVCCPGGASRDDLSHRERSAMIEKRSGTTEIFATAGIHPNEAATADPGDWDRILALVKQARVVGVGETGLDRHWNNTPFPMQEEYFARHLELARLHDLPVVIHCREAEEDVLRMLREAFERHGPIHGVMHSFVGSAATAEECLAMGLRLSFAGMLTYKNAGDVREVARKVPLDRVMVETDCPYLSPVPLRGKRNEPANVVHTAACLAELHGINSEALAERTTSNARAFFRLPVEG